MMESACASDMRAHLERLFQEELSVTEFRQWFMSAWWSAESSALDSELRIGPRIENLVYILDSGEWSDDRFRASLSEETVEFMRSVHRPSRFPVAS
jgi:hypothetical protein